MISPPPINENDLTSRSWGKWFNSIFTSFRNVETEGDVIVDSLSRGLVVKSPNGHYWRISISNSGVISGADLGLSKPKGI